MLGVEIQRLVYDRATPSIIEKLWFKGVAACVWHFRILHMTRKSIKCIWAEPFEMNIKIEQELNFGVDDSRLFIDAQEAKKVSERTVDR